FAAQGALRQRIDFRGAVRTSGSRSSSAARPDWPGYSTAGCRVREPDSGILAHRLGHRARSCCVETTLAVSASRPAWILRMGGQLCCFRRSLEKQQLQTEPRQDRVAEEARRGLVSSQAELPARSWRLLCRTAWGNCVLPGKLPIGRCNATTAADPIRPSRDLR